MARSVARDSGWREVGGLVAALGVILLVACGGSHEPAEAPVLAAPEVKVAAPEPIADEAEEDASPGQPETEPTDCADELRDARDIAREPGDELYDQALAAERAQDWQTARKSYFELIQRSPRSALIPYAYLAFGEMFSNESKDDAAKWALAKSAYREVLKYPGTPAADLAHLRLAQSKIEDAPSRMNEAARVAKPGGVANACRLWFETQGRGALLDAYVEAGRPDRAASFLTSRLGKEVTSDALVELAQRYLDAGKREEVCELLRGAGTSADLAARLQPFAGKAGCAP